MSPSTTQADRPDPQLADTAVGPQTPRPGREHARVKSIVRDALFGGGTDPVRIGRFTVLRKLGAGGMGVVYSAFDEDLDRRVAIKLLRPTEVSSPARRARLRREAQAIARLSHPNVLPIFDVGEHDSEVFLAMEFVQGSTLQAWATEQERPWTELRDLAGQAGRGLAAAHTAGIVHRDFKPENVMVGQDGRVRVVDFGVAALVQGEDPDHGSPAGANADAEVQLAKLTVEGSLVGTPAYMAPEALRGDVVDARSDQFSFAVTVWELAFAASPFGGGDPTQRLTQIEAGPPQAPGTRGLPPWAIEALRKGMSSEPADRFETMDDLLAALEYDPSGRRRRIGLGMAAVVVAGSVGATAYAFTRPDECASDAETLREIWNPQRRTAIESALAANPKVALGAWTTAATSMDDYSARWRQASTDGCETNPDDEQVALTRRLCLQWGLDGLRPIAEGLERGDPGLVAATPSAVEELPDPLACLDPDRVAKLADARARRGAPAPKGSELGLISDFESGAHVSYGAGWASSADTIIGGESTVALSIERDAEDESSALLIKGIVVANDPVSWAGAMLFTGERPFSPANLQAKRTLWFEARGEPGPRVVMLFTSRTGFAPAMARFDVTDEWQRFEFDLDALESERFDVTGVFLGSSFAGPFDLFVDDVHID